MNSLRLAQEHLRQPVTPPSTTVSNPPFLQHLWSSIYPKGLLSKVSCMSPNSQDFEQATSTNIPPGDIATSHFAINILLDELLLEIFAFYVEGSQMRDAWHTLACVCRRWHSIAFGSPRRLNLRIFCSERIPVRRNLDIWPPFPIVLNVDFYRKLGEDNILAILERHDRACEISIWNISSSLWEKALPLMQKQFPLLTNLSIRYTDQIMASVIPDSFLDGSAPGLRKLYLECIPYPGLPRLLLSATDLVHLELYEIPDSGYFSADAITTCLSTLTRLELFRLCFESPLPLPQWERRRTSPRTRALLPSLTYFMFKGVSEYLEDIVDRIDAPLLDRFRINFFHQPIFDTPRLAQFISRLPNLKNCNQARMRLGGWHTSITGKVLSLSKTSPNAYFLLEDWRGRPDFQLSPLVQLCTSSFPRALIPTVEDLIIVGFNFPRPPGQDDVDPSLWRELLRPFTAVKDLYLFPEIVPRIALVLQGLVGESGMGILPVLQNVFLKELEPSGLVPEGIKQFIATRQLAGHHVSVSLWAKQ